jgi:hypothetical protein
MGRKERGFAPLVNVSLDELVPPDYFYRYLVRTLDLSFVRDLVRTPRPQQLCKTGGQGARAAWLTCYSSGAIRRL